MEPTWSTLVGSAIVWEIVAQIGALPRSPGASDMFNSDTFNIDKQHVAAVRRRWRLTRSG
jgi:hypothetical protein